jgi:energy-coupling factor transporter ATP-binding protein EcfA2
MSDIIALSDKLREKLLDPSNLPTELIVREKKYDVEKPIKAGFKGAIWLVKNEFGRLRAAKLAICEDYENRSYLQEVSRLEPLEDYDVFAKIFNAGITEVTFSDGSEHRFVCLIEEWIDGFNLEDFLKDYKMINVTFFMSYVDALCRALNALKLEKLSHDDLHNRNVMIALPKKGDIQSLWRIKVVDMGSLKPAVKPSLKPKDDHRHFVDHLVQIANTIHDKRILSIRDRRFLVGCIDILNSMLDEGRKLEDPREILGQFQYLDSRSSSVQPAKPLKLYSPFEYISAEHIPDDRLLIKLFAESCPWLNKVSGPDPCLVTGPRGCGKSTIFRWLSLKAHLHKPIAELESLRITGFYVSCSIDLQNRLGWINSEALAKRFRKECCHYFNLLLAREIMITLERIASEEDKKKHWGLTKWVEQKIYNFIVTAIHPQTHFKMEGISLLAQAREEIEKEMFNAHTTILRGRNLSHTLPDTFLGDFTTLLVENLPLFENRKIAFLLDDYSTHRLPEPLQVELNRIVWERRPTHVFKLSSEKYGSILRDPNNATADLTREMIEVDCGREFLALNESDARKKAIAFTTDLLNYRLENAEFDGKAEQLIGKSPKESLAIALRNSYGKSTNRGHSANYYGLERISDLCSGDISHLLYVYRKIFESAGIDQYSNKLIPPNKQHDCVVEVSRELTISIKSLLPYGIEMYNIIDAFGNLVRRILQYGRLQGGNRIPPESPRIEIDQKEGSVVDHLSGTPQDIALELIRRAVFIEMKPGLSRHKHVTALRWQVRRIYLPGFGASLAKNNAIKKDPDWFKHFITSPDEACEDAFKDWPKSDPEGYPLFKSEE